MTKKKHWHPRKLSTALKQCVRDVLAIAKNPKYELNMYTWHLPAAKCGVCMSGSVIACRLPSGPRKSLLPDDFDTRTSNALCAMDAARYGNLEQALKYLASTSREWDDVRAVELVLTKRQTRVLDQCSELIEEGYAGNQDGHAPWDVYLDVADRLAKVGL